METCTATALLIEERFYYDFKAKWFMMGTGGPGLMGIVFRHIDTFNYYTFEYHKGHF
jgi:hypothetical protein